jgi:hypothetical protein
MIYITISIDVEGVHCNSPFESMIMGRPLSLIPRALSRNNEYGVQFIADIISHYGLKAIFFIDTYERILHGNAAMTMLIKNLSRMGHSCELHTHPSWRIDSRDSYKITALKNVYKDRDCDLMALLDYKTQLSFISQEKSWLSAQTGRPVLAHRSGGYSINQDTVIALENNNIKLDFSFNPFHSNCKLSYADLDDYCCKFVPVSSIFMGNKRRIIKLDLCRTPPSLIKSLCNRLSLLSSEGYDFLLDIMTHSYGLLAYSKDFKQLSPSRVFIRNLREVCSFVSSHPMIKVVDSSEACNLSKDQSIRSIFSDDRLLQANTVSFWQRLKNSSTLNSNPFFIISGLL